MVGMCIVVIGWYWYKVKMVTECPTVDRIMLNFSVIERNMEFKPLLGHRRC